MRGSMHSHLSERVSGPRDEARKGLHDYFFIADHRREAA
jgi:hypothetical protein